MAEALVLGGGFGGVVAAERLAKLLAPEHRITLVSRRERFVFSPALVRLAFGKCEPDDISFDLREALLDRRVSFVRAEVARVEPRERRVVTAHGEIEGRIPYDYLVFALGRRLAAELEGREPSARYEHELKLVIDEGGDSSIYFHKSLGAGHDVSVRQGRFWGWAKRVHERYWEGRHA